MTARPRPLTLDEQWDRFTTAMANMAINWAQKHPELFEEEEKRGGASRRGHTADKKNGRLDAWNTEPAENEEVEQ